MSAGELSNRPKRKFKPPTLAGISLKHSLSSLRVTEFRKTFNPPMFKGRLVPRAWNRDWMLFFGADTMAVWGWGITLFPICSSAFNDNRGLAIHNGCPIDLPCVFNTHMMCLPIDKFIEVTPTANAATSRINFA